MKRLKAKFAGKCRNCGASIAKGDPIFWTPAERGALCEPCGKSGADEAEEYDRRVRSAFERDERTVAKNREALRDTLESLPAPAKRRGKIEVGDIVTGVPYSTRGMGYGRSGSIEYGHKTGLVFRTFEGKNGPCAVVAYVRGLYADEAAHLVLDELAEEGLGLRGVHLVKNLRRVNLPARTSWMTALLRCPHGCNMTQWAYSENCRHCGKPLDSEEREAALEDLQKDVEALTADVVAHLLAEYEAEREAKRAAKAAEGANS